MYSRDEEYQWLKNIKNNQEFFANEVKKSIKIKDYGIYSMKISESVTYPKMTDMKQDVWLSKKDKIEILYKDTDKNYEITIKFKKEAILESYSILECYINSWFYLEKDYFNKLKVYINKEKIPIICYCDLQILLNKKTLNSEETFENFKYSRTMEGVWVDMNKTLEIFKKSEENDFFILKIEKVEKIKNRTQPWNYISCFNFTYESKFYEEGFLESLEWKRVEKLIVK